MPVSAPPRNQQTYRSRVHWLFVVAVSIITILSFLVGWFLRPQDSPPALRGANLLLTYAFNQCRLIFR
jgi:hypothetical protein